MLPSPLTSPNNFRWFLSDPLTYVPVQLTPPVVMEYAGLGGTIPSAKPPSSISVTGVSADAVRCERLKHAVIVVALLICCTTMVSELLPSSTASLMPCRTSAHSPTVEFTVTGAGVTPPDHQGAAPVCVHGAAMPDASTGVVRSIVPAGSVMRPAWPTSCCRSSV